MSRGTAAGSVEQALRALAADDSRVQVPSCVEATVMLAWEAETRAVSPRAARRGGRARWVAVLSTAGMSAAALLFALSQRTAEAPRSSPAPADVTPALHSGTDVAPRAVSNAVASTRARKVSQTRVTRAAAPPQPDASLTLAADPLLDAAEVSIVRVRMPRSALASLGIPIVDPDAAGSVELEMLVGEDGIARTIRRASPWPRTNQKE